MNYVTVEQESTPCTAPAQQLVEYRVDQPVYHVSRRIERELQDVHQSGNSVRTVHPDDGVPATIQTYESPNAQLDLTHHRAPDGDGYIAEIHIRGDAQRVEELERDLDSLLELL